jgi:hypothetical protein
MTWLPPGAHGRRTAALQAFRARLRSFPDD